jgi:hypothetical protein
MPASAASIGPSPRNRPAMLARVERVSSVGMARTVAARSDRARGQWTDLRRYTL